MKTEIHPKYYENAKVICACGNAFTVGSTVEEMHIEICSNCHPFFTGKQKVMDTQGRVERFQRMREQKKVHAEKAKAKKSSK